MPRVYHRKARKDYPESGIKKGQMYYRAQIKTGPRSSRVLKQLTPFKPSQLTTSEFFGEWFSIQEGFDDSENMTSEAVSGAADDLRSLADDTYGKFENLPEGFQQAYTGELLEMRSDACNEAADLLEELASQLEELEQGENENFDEELERIGSEVEEVLANTPE